MLCLFTNCGTLKSIKLSDSVGKPGTPGYDLPPVTCWRLYRLYPAKSTGPKIIQHRPSTAKCPIRMAPKIERSEDHLQSHPFLVSGDLSQRSPMILYNDVQCNFDATCTNRWRFSKPFPHCSEDLILHAAFSRV